MCIAETWEDRTAVLLHYHLWLARIYERVVALKWAQRHAATDAGPSSPLFALKARAQSRHEMQDSALEGNFPLPTFLIVLSLEGQLRADRIWGLWTPRALNHRQREPPAMATERLLLQPTLTTIESSLTLLVGWHVISLLYAGQARAGTRYGKKPIWEEPILYLKQIFVCLFVCYNLIPCLLSDIRCHKAAYIE